MNSKTILPCLALLVSMPSVDGAEQPVRTLFSIEVIADGGGLQRAGGSSVGDKISLCEWKGGWITAERHVEWHGELAKRNPDDKRFGSGPEFTSEMREALKKANLNLFDFDAEITKAKKIAGDFVLVGGVTVRVTVDEGTNHFSFDAVGLRFFLDRYSPYNPRLKALKELVDRLEYQYGRMELMYF